MEGLTTPETTPIDTLRQDVVASAAMRAKDRRRVFAIVSKKQPSALSAFLRRQSFVGLCAAATLNEAAARGLRLFRRQCGKPWPFVPSLLAACRPTHIARFVVTIVIDPIDRIVWRWALTDISEKGRKVVSPFVADGYAPTPIAEKLLRVRVVATLFDTKPDAIQRMDRPNARQAVCDCAH
jgi:hypothetical protein